MRFGYEITVVGYISFVASRYNSKICKLGTSLHGEMCVHICEIYAVKYVQKVFNKRLLNL